MNAAIEPAGEAARPPQARMRVMREEDLDAVMAIERRAYEFPWTIGIFRDCLRAGYGAWLLERPDRGDPVLVGYGVLSVAAGEAHVLNLCTAPEARRSGHARRMLRELARQAQARGAQRLFLEVRPSNPHAVALYHDEGFNESGRRPRYYPARGGREDAIVMARELLA